MTASRMRKIKITRYALWLVIVINVAITSHWSVVAAVIFTAITLELQTKLNDQQAAANDAIHEWAGEINKTLGIISTHLERIDEDGK